MRNHKIRNVDQYQPEIIEKTIHIFGQDGYETTYRKVDKIEERGNGGNGGRPVNIRFNNVLIYIIVTWHRIKQCTVKIMKVLRIKLT